MAKILTDVKLTDDKSLVGTIENGEEISLNPPLMGKWSYDSNFSLEENIIRIADEEFKDCYLHFRHALVVSSVRKIFYHKYTRRES